MLKELLGESVVVRPELAQMPQTALVCGPGVKALWRLANSTLHLGVGDGRSDGNCNRFGDLVLKRENVRERAIVAISPEMLASFSFSQLCGNSDAIAGLAHTAFEHIAHTKLATDPSHIDRAALISEAGVAS